MADNNNGGSGSLHAVEAQSLANTSSRSFFVTQIILRILAAMSALASIAVMLNSAQSTEVFGIQLQAKYSYSSAFRYNYSITNCCMRRYFCEIHFIYGLNSSTTIKNSI